MLAFLYSLSHQHREKVFQQNQNISNLHGMLGFQIQYMRLNLIGCLRLSLTRSLESEPAISTDAPRLAAFATTLTRYMKQI